jgi:endonuclease/exonuclease/phosphatase (EEP) superfamily protein YafD
MRTVLFWCAVLVVMVPALLLTMSRLVEPSGGRWIRAVSFTPFAMFLYLGVLVVLAVGTLRRRSGRSVVTIGVACLAAVGLTLHVWWFAPMVTGANPPPKGAQTLRVMTANVYGGSGDGVALVEAVSREDVDLLVVEEIAESQLAAMESAGIDELLPYSVGETGALGQGTMVFSRQPLGQATHLDTTWDGWQTTMGDLTLLAVHPISPTDPEGWRSDHAAILAAAEASHPDLIVGDLNATVDHEPMRRLADAGYRSATELANEGWQPTWPAYGVVHVAGMEVPRLVQIDHVLVGHRLAALGTHTLTIPGADHRALVAELAVK